jgi:spore coat protein CotH
MGNNSYLYYDTRTQRFTVVAWDHNLAFGMMGGAGGPKGGGADWPGMRTEGFDGQVPEGMQSPAVEQPSPEAQWPENMQPPEDGGGQPGGGRSLGGRSNILVERFMANPEWKQFYEETLAELTSKLYESRAAADILDDWVALLKTQAADLIFYCSGGGETSSNCGSVTIFPSC